jgi:protocatechuate 3,4-dioxygenase beta subunit
VLWPAVLRPRQIADSASPDSMRLLLAHELSHVQRHDLAWGWLQALVNALFFFHPFAWLLRRESRLAQELACDELALEATQARPAQLGELLLSVCTIVRAAGRIPASAALPVASAARHLRRRINAMRRQRPRASRRQLASSAIIVAMLGTAALLPWRLIAREPDAPSVPGTAANDDKQPAYTGRVLGPTGAPVEGALVSSIDLDPANTVNRITLSTARTAADGSFRLPRVHAPGGTQASPTFMVEADGLAIGAGRAGLSNGADIRLPPSTELRIAFHGPDGKPVAGLEVWPRFLVERKPLPFASSSIVVPSDARKRFAHRTDANGLLTIPGLPQRWMVDLDIDDERFARLVYDHRVSLAAEAITQAKPLTLMPASSIHGRVAFGDGDRPVAGVLVRAQSVERRGVFYGDSITGADGTYRIGRLSEGQYNVSVELGEELDKQWAVAAVAELKLARGQQSAAPDMTLIRGGVLTGRVLLGDTMQPVPGISTGLHGPARPRSGGAMQDRHTDTEGRFTFRVPAGQQFIYMAQSPPDGYLAPEANARKLVQQDVADGATVTYDIILPRDPSPPVTGRVLDADGKPVVGAMVLAELPSGDWSDQRVANTDARGEFRYVALASGALLRASKGPLTSAEATAVGENRDNLVLTIRENKPASLIVTVLDPDGRAVKGAEIAISVQTGQFGMGMNYPDSFTDAQGRYVFDSLASDKRYHIAAAADGFGESQRHVPQLQAGQRTELEPLTLPRADRVVAGRVLDKDGKPAAGIEVVISSGIVRRSTSTTDAQGRFALKVVAGSRPFVYMLTPDNRIVRGRETTAGDEDVELVYDPAAAR